MGIVLLIVLGAISGWIASLIMGSNARQGIFTDIILGIVGGILGGVIMNFFGQPGITGFNLYSILVAVIGAVSIGMARQVNYGGKQHYPSTVKAVLKTIPIFGIVFYLKIIKNLLKLPLTTG